MQFLRLFLTFALVINIGKCPVFAQQNHSDTTFSPPVDIPIYLAGDFGELRADHFHAGIDIKTEGVIGQKVFAAGKGYISRIKIQSGGYGHSLYINHPNGYTTVYGHLSAYIPEIEKFIKDIQYQRKSFEVDVYLPPDKFPVSRHQLVAYSGNTGFSGGPHLHFEIRTTKDQVPVNVLKFGSDIFNIKDKIKPVIYRVGIYPLDNKSFVDYKNQKDIEIPFGNNGNYKLNGKPVNVSGNIGFGVETYDYMNGTNNRFAVYSIKLLVDSTLIYYHTMDKVSFYVTSYVKSQVDYEQRVKNKLNIQKLFLDPNNKLKIYKDVLNHGEVAFNDDTLHTVDIIVKDAFSNTSKLSFQVESYNKVTSTATTDLDSNFVTTFYYNQPNLFQNSEVKVYIPAYVLYNNINFKYARINGDSTMYSDIHYIQDEYTPVNKDYELSLRTRDLPARLENKALIVNIDKDNKYTAEGGNWDNGFVTANADVFGKFVVLVDTVPPEIVPIHFNNNGKYYANQVVSFKINDDLSGIKNYNGYIDGQWALFEYDKKTDSISYTIDPDRLSPGQKHHLEIVVIDKKDNSARYTGAFYY